MELRPGYKQTDVGVVPTDWKIEPLGEHAAFRTGPFGSALHKSDYTNDGIPVVNPMHIVEGRIEPTRTMTITEDAAKNLCDFRLKPGEIIIGRRGDMGRCAVVQKHQAGWLCGTGSMIVRPVCADADFLQRVLSSPRAIAAIQDASVGTTMVNLNQGTLAGLKIQFPPLPEQRAIATALRDVDALLGGLDQLIAKKRDLKQAAVLRLLTGKEKLPGFQSTWEEVPIGERIDLVTGFPFPSTLYVKGGIRLLRGSNIKRGETDWSEALVKFWPSRSSDLAIYEMNAGDLVVAMDGSLVGRSYARLSERDLPCLLLQRVARIRSKTIDIGFLTQHIGSDRFIKYCDSVKTVTAIPHISPSDIKNFKVFLPSDIREQIAIAEVLSDIEQEIATLEARKKKTRALKQGMMQELLTGKTRLVRAGGADA